MNRKVRAVRTTRIARAVVFALFAKGRMSIQLQTTTSISTYDVIEAKISASGRPSMRTTTSTV